MVFLTLKGKEAENASQLRDEKIVNIMKKNRDQKKACTQPCVGHHAKYFTNIVHQLSACSILGEGPYPLRKSKLIKFIRYLQTIIPQTHLPGQNKIVPFNNPNPLFENIAKICKGE